jgi:hypothetical protein
MSFVASGLRARRHSTADAMVLPRQINAGELSASWCHRNAARSSGFRHEDVLRSPVMAVRPGVPGTGA